MFRQNVLTLPFALAVFLTYHAAPFISKNYYLRPELQVHLTHGTLRTQTEVLDATSDRCRVRKIPLSSSHVLTPAGHAPFRPVRPDDV